MLEHILLKLCRSFRILNIRNLSPKRTPNPPQRGLQYHVSTECCSLSEHVVLIGPGTQPLRPFLGNCRFKQTGVINGRLNTMRIIHPVPMKSCCSPPPLLAAKTILRRASTSSPNSTDGFPAPANACSAGSSPIATASALSTREVSQPPLAKGAPPSGNSTSRDKGSLSGRPSTPSTTSSWLPAGTFAPKASAAALLTAENVAPVSMMPSAAAAPPPPGTMTRTPRIPSSGSSTPLISRIPAARAVATPSPGLHKRSVARGKSMSTS
mmetsp:Transcript_181413/g.575868  ORF Transcript_181413/g.575868 Transcript_181413/m.575868 type:complete len:267 (-) Transcript_181413:710-1510(-)